MYGLQKPQLSAAFEYTVTVADAFYFHVYLSYCCAVYTFFFLHILIKVIRTYYEC